jgi:hypothetical protein
MKIAGWAEVVGKLYCTALRHAGDRRLAFGAFAYASERDELWCLACAKAARVLG